VESEGGALRVSDASPPEIRGLVDPLAPDEPTWSDARIAGGPKGIVAARAAIDGTAGSWVYDLWLLEHIAESLGLEPLKPAADRPGVEVALGVSASGSSPTASAASYLLTTIVSEIVPARGMALPGKRTCSRRRRAGLTRLRRRNTVFLKRHLPILMRERRAAAEEHLLARLEREPDPAGAGGSCAASRTSGSAPTPTG
jgi:hypothetical protein